MENLSQHFYAMEVIFVTVQTPDFNIGHCNWETWYYQYFVC
jgi:hypothetical protein